MASLYVTCKHFACIPPVGVSHSLVTSLTQQACQVEVLLPLVCSNHNAMQHQHLPTPTDSYTELSVVDYNIWTIQPSIAHLPQHW